MSPRQWLSDVLTQVPPRRHPRPALALAAGFAFCTGRAKLAVDHEGCIVGQLTCYLDGVGQADCA
jgi:hypothetical protein